MTITESFLFLTDCSKKRFCSSFLQYPIISLFVLPSWVPQKHCSNSAKAELCDHCCLSICLSVCHSASNNSRTRYGCRPNMEGM